MKLQNTKTILKFIPFLLLLLTSCSNNNARWTPNETDCHLHTTRQGDKVCQNAQLVVCDGDYKPGKCGDGHSH